MPHFRVISPAHVRPFSSSTSRRRLIPAILLLTRLAPTDGVEAVEPVQVVEEMGEIVVMATRYYEEGIDRISANVTVSIELPLKPSSSSPFTL